MKLFDIKYYERRDRRGRFGNFRKWNKGFDFEYTKNCKVWRWFNFHIYWTTKVDHAGFYVELELCGVELEFSVYDTRHWDEKTKCWVQF